MSEMIIRRTHTLGLERARTIGRTWANYLSKKLDMTVNYTEGETSDRSEFSRMGVKGYSIVTHDSLEIHVTLGMLFKPFAGQIESEMTRRLDEAIAYEHAQAAAGK